MDNKQKALLAGGVLGGLFVGANAGKILRGIGIGLLAIFVAFFVIYQSVSGVQENSASVGSMELQAIADVGDHRGMVKVYGEVSTEEPVSFTLETCGEDPLSQAFNISDDVFCLYPEEALKEDNLLYYYVSLQQFEVTREVDENEDGSETINYVHDWIEKDTMTEWAEVSIGEVNLDMKDARRLVEEEDEVVTDVYIEDLEDLKTYGREPASDEPEFGTTRAVVIYIPQDDREYIVVGEMRSSGISSGTPFLVTDKSDTELVDQLGSEETTQRWLLRALAFILLTFGFTSMLSPILIFTDMIPLAGKVARGAATTIAAVIAGIIVLATVFLLNFWWVIALGFVIAVVIFGAVSMGLGKRVEPQPPENQIQS